MTPSTRLRNRVHAELATLLDPSSGSLGTTPLDVTAFLDGDLLDEVAVEYRSLATEAPAEGRAAIIAAGPPGAGKSTALTALLDQHRRIDPDEVKDILLQRLEDEGLLAERQRYVLLDGHPVRPAELAWWVHRASTDVADLVRQVSLTRGENFAMEGTLSWEPLVEEYNTELLTFGYETLVVLDVEVSLETAIQQARTRWWTGRTTPNGIGGRFVPDTALASYYPDNNRVSICATRARAMYADATDSGIPTTLALESRTTTGMTSAPLVEPTGVEEWRGLTLGTVCVRCGLRLTDRASINRGLGDDCYRHAA